MLKLIWRFILMDGEIWESPEEMSLSQALELFDSQIGHSVDEDIWAIWPTEKVLTAKMMPLR